MMLDFDKVAASTGKISSFLENCDDFTFTSTFNQQKKGIAKQSKLRIPVALARYPKT